MKIELAKEKVYEFLLNKNSFCKKKTVLEGLQMKSNTLNRALRMLRNEGLIRYTRRRWGYCNYAWIYFWRKTL